MGVGFQQSETPVLSTGNVKLLTGDSAEAVNEAQLSFVDLARREQFVGEIRWTRGYAPGSVLKTYKVPTDFMVSKTISAAFERFKYFHGDCHVRFMLQSNSFQAGQVIIDYAPLTDMLPAEITSMTSRTVRNNLLLRAGSTKSGTIVIPYAHLRHYITKEEAIPLATLSCTVMNELRVGEGDPGICMISVFVSFPNAQFKVIDPIGDITIENFSQGGVASKVTNINIDHVANSSLDMHGMTDSMEAKQKGEITGCDRPNVGLSYHPARLMKYPDLANGSNIDYCNRMALDSGGCTSMNPLDISTSENEMDLRVLLRKWSYLSTYPMHIGDKTGKVITTGPMSPTPWSQNAIIDPTGARSSGNSLLEFLCLPFAMWRGSLEYRFEFVTTKIHTARVAFSTHYGSASLTNDMLEAMSQYAEIMDVTGDNYVFEVSIPYRAPTDWCYVAHGSEHVHDPFDMGQWSLRVVNALIGMESVSDVIDVNVYVRAGEDFELRYFDIGAHDVYSDQMISQGDEFLGDVGEDQVQDDAATNVVVAPSDQKRKLGGDWYNLRNYFKRSAHIETLTSGKLYPTDALFTTLSKKSALSYYGSLFRVWFGDLRVRHFTNKDAIARVTFVGDLIPDQDAAFFTASLENPMGPVMQTDAEVGVLDFQIPWYSPYNFCLVDHHWQLKGASHRWLSPSQFGIVEGTGTTTNLGDPASYVAAGENFRFAMLYNVPQLRMFTTNDALYQHAGQGTVSVPKTLRLNLTSVLFKTGSTDKVVKNPSIFEVCEDIFVIPQAPVASVFDDTTGDGINVTLDFDMTVLTFEQILKFTGIKVTQHDRIVWTDSVWTTEYQWDEPGQPNKIKFCKDGQSFVAADAEYMYANKTPRRNPKATLPEPKIDVTYGTFQSTGEFSDYPDTDTHPCTIAGSYQIYKAECDFIQVASYFGATRDDSQPFDGLVFFDETTSPDFFTKLPAENQAKFLKARGSLDVKSSGDLATGWLFSDSPQEGSVRPLRTAVIDP